MAFLLSGCPPQKQQSQDPSEAWLLPLLLAEHSFHRAETGYKASLTTLSNTHLYFLKLGSTIPVLGVQGEPLGAGETVAGSSTRVMAEWVHCLVTATTNM